LGKREQIKLYNNTTPQFATIQNAMRKGFRWGKIKWYNGMECWNNVKIEKGERLEL